MNTPAVCQHAFGYDDAGRSTNVLMQQLSAKVFKLSFEYLHIYSPKMAIFAKNSKIASLMSCQRSDLRKTLKYSQSRDLEGILDK